MLSFYSVTPVGPLAMISYEPRQARKGATVVANSCAAVRLAGLPLLTLKRLTLNL